MGGFTTQNDTFACSDTDCLISCQSPEFGSQCAGIGQNFLDGTSCQGGGRCSNGMCKGSSLTKEIKSWIDNNKTLVIALSCGIGGLLVISIISCCFSRYRRRQRQAARAALIASRPPPRGPPPGWQQAQQRGSQYGGGGGNQAYMSPAMSQQQQTPQYYSRNIPNSHMGGGGWGNDGRWNPNAGYGNQPPPPVWQPSVRYA